MRLSEFTERYLQLHFCLLRRQWESYRYGHEGGLDEISARIYRLLERARQHIPRGEQDPQTRIAQNIIQRGLVDEHPEVSRLRNRIDEIFFSLDSEPDAGQLKPLVLQLMQLRNQRARRQGFCSYPDLVFDSQNLDRREVEKMVRRYLLGHAEQARDIISRYGLNHQNWFGRLLEVSRTCPVDARELYRCAVKRLGYPAEIVDRLSIHVGEDLFGFVTAFSVPDDVRVMIQPVRSLQQLKVACHELGHALVRALNQGRGLAVTAGVTHDECMAVLIEQLGLQLLLDEDDRRLAQEICLVENVRMAVSFSFEMDLWEHPDGADEFYRCHYSSIGWSQKTPDAWVLDTFRSLDPVYMHNYILGAVVAEKTRDHLHQIFGCRPEKWGCWIRDNYFADGRRRSLREKTAGVVDWVTEG